MPDDNFIALLMRPVRAADLLGGTRENGIAAGRINKLTITEKPAMDSGKREAPRPQQQAGARESRQGTAEGGDNGRGDPAWIALQLMLLRVKAQVARALRERDGR